MPAVLFVCTANIIRSPIAEYLLKEKLRAADLAGEWQVESAGTWARPGYGVDPIAAELLADQGIEVSQHTSREVNRDLLEEADIVLVMEIGHREALQIEFPAAADKVHLLSELGNIQQDVADPVGKPTLEYRAALREISQYLDNAPHSILNLLQKRQ